LATPPEHPEWVVPSRRLDDRIRDLCAKIITASENEQEFIQKQLQSAIREKIQQLRKMAADKLLDGRDRSNGQAEDSDRPDRRETA